MIARRRAAGEQQLRHCRQCGGVQHVWRHACPDRVQPLKPSEQLGILHAGNRSREALIHVVMSIDQTRNNDAVLCVDDFVRIMRQIGCGANRLNHVVADEDRRITQFATRIIKGGDGIGVADQERGHLSIFGGNGHKKSRRNFHAAACSSRERRATYLPPGTLPSTPLT